MAERYPDRCTHAVSASTPPYARRTRRQPTCALRRGVLEYDRRGGYRRPEGYAELPASPGDDDFEEALADHPDNDELLAAVVLAQTRSRSRRRCAAASRSRSTARACALQRAPSIRRRRRSVASGAARSSVYRPKPAASPGKSCSCPRSSRLHRARCTGRRGARARGRLRLRPQQIQSRDPGVAPARLSVQAVHLFGVAGEGLHARHRHRRRAGGAGGRADRKPALGAEKLRRQVRGSHAHAHRAGEVEEHGVDPHPRRDRRQISQIT